MRLNFYAFADGNPVSLMDPFGLGAMDDLGSGSWLNQQWTPCIECHGVSAFGFNGNPNAFAGLSTLPSMGPYNGQYAMEGYQELSFFTRFMGGLAASYAGPVARLLAAKNTTTLDWSIVSKAGETRAAHVTAQHGALNLQKPVQGVFYGNPVSTLDDAWAIAQQQGIKPITSGGADIHVIPRANSGYAGGYLGQGQNLNTVTIITQPGTPKIITGYPGNGTPLPYP